MDKNTTNFGDSFKGVVTNMPDENIKFQPEFVSPYTEFPIGITFVKVKAFNLIGDEVECGYRVQVKGKISYLGLFRTFENIYDWTSLLK